MGARIALCADEVSCAQPGLIGLDGENLGEQEWLELHVEGSDARRRIAASEDLSEAWVVSCSDVAAINLAAALKADRPELSVCLVDFEGGGSLLSRAHTAQIDEVLGRSAFVERYNQAKQQAAKETQLDGALSVPQKAEVESGALAVAPRAIADVEQVAQIATELSLIAHAPGRGFIMPVVSGSGGAGKSSVSVLGAFVAHEMGYRTLLLDYDLQFGDAAIMAGIENPLTIDELIDSPERLEQEMKRGGGPTLVAAPQRLEMAERVVRATPALLDRIAPTFDVVIANTGAAWADQHAVLLEKSTAVLFLVDQRASSVRACKHALELCARCGIATGQFQFVLNRCGKNVPLSAVDVSNALQGAPVAELREGGRDVEDYLASGSAAELLQTGNELCSGIRRLIAQVLPDEQRIIQVDDAGGNHAAPRKRGRHGAKRRGWGR